MIKATVIPQTQLSYAIAEELFGWRWLAHFGRPTHSALNYPEPRMVRRFFPPDKDLHPSWQDHFKEVPHTPANGDESLDYCYGSSNGPHTPPAFTSDLNAVQQMEKEVHRRGLWDKYQQILAVSIKRKVTNTSALAFASPEKKCLAALAAIGSKYVIET